MDPSRVMSALKLARIGLVSLAAVCATGCYGKAGPDAFVAGAIVGTAILSAASAHAEQERERAWERERDDAPVYTQVYVVHDRETVETPAPALVPAAAPPPPFDAKTARNALAGVDLEACRSAGAPRGYGHAKATVNPSGDVSKVVIDEPAGMPVAAVKCIGDAIGRVTVPEFSGSFVTVGTTYFVP
jgi:hypothetical protein